MDFSYIYWHNSIFTEIDQHYVSLLLAANVEYIKDMADF